jgi:hypothetical protein
MWQIMLPGAEIILVTDVSYILRAEIILVSILDYCAFDLLRRKLEDTTATFQETLRAIGSSLAASESRLATVSRERDSAALICQDLEGQLQVPKAGLGMMLGAFLGLRSLNALTLLAPLVLLYSGGEGGEVDAGGPPASVRCGPRRPGCETLHGSWGG